MRREKSFESLTAPTPTTPRPVPTVASSAILRIEYESGTRILHVTFRETGSYRYFDVPRAIYEEFLAAPSKGQFFNERIRDRYPVERRN